MADAIDPVGVAAIAVVAAAAIDSCPRFVGILPQCPSPHPNRPIHRCWLCLWPLQVVDFAADMVVA